MDLKVAAVTTCHFLRLPPEIRLRIYRYLLLEPPRAFLDPCYQEKAFEALIAAQHKIGAFIDENGVDEDEHEDLDSESSVNGNDSYKYSYNNPSGAVMYNHLIVDQPDPPCETPSSPPPVIDEGLGRQSEKLIAERERERKFDEEYKVQRHTAILQTNKQIYTEASAFLYSSLVVEVRPGDVMFSDTWDGVVELGDKIWRSCPLQSGAKSPIERPEYKESNLGGTMEPHAFTKFERVSFVADLDFVDRESTNPWPTFFVDEDLHTRREDEASFVARLNGEDSERPPVSNIFQQLVDVLVKSPYISHLDVTLDVELGAEFDIDSEDDEGEDVDNEGNNEAFKEQNAKEEKQINVANQRATELVLEAGILNPLKQLSKVKCFGLSFALLPWNGIPFTPKSKHLDIIRDLKKTVEGNFVAKHGGC